MELDAYADRAVALANADLEDLADARRLLREQLSAWYAQRATDDDVTALRRVAGQLRRVFADAAGGEDARAVKRLNALLVAYPVTPRISGHDHSDWHLHVSSGADGSAAELVTSACYGLALAVADLGVRRLGVCARPDCGNAFLARNGGRPRQWCSDRCANRANVAAFRARRRAAG